MEKKLYLGALLCILTLTGCRRNTSTSVSQVIISGNDNIEVSISSENDTSSIDATIVSSSSINGQVSSSSESTTPTISSSESISSSVSSSIINYEIYDDDLIISEFWHNRYKKNVYDDGGNNDKALELYNPSDRVVDLSQYHIDIYSSGYSEIKNNDYRITLNGSLEPKTTYTIVDSYAQEKIKAKADLVTKVYIGGKSSVGLYKGNTLIDVFGIIGKEYASDDDVVINGVESALFPHNVVRKEGFLRSTTFNEEEWEVRFDTNLSTLGKYGLPKVDPTFDGEEAKIALSLLIEEYYNDNVVTGDITLVEEYEGYKFRYSVPYCPEFYNEDGTMKKEPESPFYIFIEITVLDKDGNDYYTDYGGVVFTKE